MNCCNFTGRLTRDPEMRYTTGGTPVANFAIAVDMGKRNGEKQTEFIEMTAFGKTAEILGKYMTKGREIAITGKFRTDKWDDKETGQKRSKSYIVVDQFSFIGSGGNRGEGGGPRESANAYSGAGGDDAGPDSYADDDIPF